MTISWSESMSVGVPALDEDHKTLIGLINLLSRSIGDEEEYTAVYSVLGSLEDYTTYHFAREEALMEACKYSQLDNHRSGHRAFAARVAEFKSKYQESRTGVSARECLTFLNDWLVNHICTTDMNYRAWVVGNPAAESSASQHLAGDRGGGLANLQNMDILVVDDNQNFCEVISTILAGVGITQVTVAHDLPEAKTVLVDRPINLVVADWHVGEGSGLDLVKWLRDGPPRLAQLPVLMLSGRERMVSRDLALLAGADEFMEKPVSARGLLICLNRLAGRRR